VIGFLRFVGVLNAAVWLGAAIFYTIGAGPALTSQNMLAVLGAKNFPYFSGAVGQIVLGSYFHLQIVCAVVALLHLLAEWLYLGRPARKFWLGLLAGLFILSAAGSFWLCPKLSRLHLTSYALNVEPNVRCAAAKSFHFWSGVLQAVNVVLIGGAAVYLWRVANPADSLRFVSPAKFR
jgi:hypothetical protein